MVLYNEVGNNACVNLCLKSWGLLEGRPRFFMWNILNYYEEISTLVEEKGLKQIGHIHIKYFKMIHILGEFVGIVLILYSIVLSLQGFTSSVMETLPGIIGISIGTFIYNSGVEAGKFIESDKKDVVAVDKMCKHISWFLILFGLLMLLFIVSYTFLLLG